MIVLSSNDAFIEFNKCDYFDRMADDELNYRTQSILSYYPNIPVSKNIKNMYKYLVDDFMKCEIDCLLYYHNICKKLFLEKLPKLLYVDPDIKFKYIKLKNNVDWNYPYTINNCVVIPQNLLNRMRKAIEDLSFNDNKIVWNIFRKNYTNINLNVGILCHEWIHIIQRYPNAHIHNILDDIYVKLWKFVKISTQGKIPNRITNPDGFNDTWQIIINDEIYTPILSLYGGIPEGFLINNFNGSWTLLKNCTKYTNNFYGLKSQLYHPNEIFAHLVSDYIILNKIYANCWNSYKFYEYLNYFV